MAFGEAVFAEALDLLEAAICEIRVVAARDHAVDEFFLKGRDRAAAAEGGHGTAQAIGFGRGEAGGNDGNPHGLFLEQGDAKCLAEDGFQFGLRVDDGLVSLAAAQIGVHHAALDGAWAHDGDLDHEVVELPWHQAWQHRHLGTAFDLEDAHGIGAAEHVVDGGLFLRDRGEGGRDTVMGLQHSQGPAHAGEHAECEDIDFQDAQRVEVILVPLNDRASFHGCVRYRDEFVEAPTRHHEAADVLGEVAGEVCEFAGKSQCQ